MSISETLFKAADLIEPPGMWTQGAFARTKVGAPTGPLTEYAVCFCLRGAVRRIERWKERRIGPADRMVLAWANWNDAPERTQSEVVAKLREIATQARSEGL